MQWQSKNIETYLSDSKKPFSMGLLTTTFQDFALPLIISVATLSYNIQDPYNFTDQSKKVK